MRSLILLLALLPIEAGAQSQKENANALKELASALSAEREVMRDPKTGNIAGSRVKREKRP